MDSRPHLRGGRPLRAGMTQGSIGSRASHQDRFLRRRKNAQPTSQTTRHSQSSEPAPKGEERESTHPNLLSFPRIRVSPREGGGGNPLSFTLWKGFPASTCLQANRMAHSILA